MQDVAPLIPLNQVEVESINWASEIGNKLGGCLPAETDVRRSFEGTVIKPSVQP